MKKLKHLKGGKRKMKAKKNKRRNAVLAVASVLMIGLIVASLGVLFAGPFVSEKSDLGGTLNGIKKHATSEASDTDEINRPIRAIPENAGKLADDMPIQVPGASSGGVYSSAVVGNKQGSDFTTTLRAEYKKPIALEKYTTAAENLPASESEASAIVRVTEARKVFLGISFPKWFPFGTTAADMVLVNLKDNEVTRTTLAEGETQIVETFEITAEEITETGVKLNIASEAA